MKTFLKNIGSDCILQNHQLIFSPKIQYKLAAERSETASSGLRFSKMWCIYKKVRTHFAENPQ
jgi:hypothetical protein